MEKQKGQKIEQLRDAINVMQTFYAEMHPVALMSNRCAIRDYVGQKGVVLIQIYRYCSSLLT